MSTSQESHGETTASLLVPHRRPPSSFPELRKRIINDLCDKWEPFKACLERAEHLIEEGEAQYSNFNSEHAFVAFARAGYLLLVKLPTHPHYMLLLNEGQQREVLHVCPFFSSSVGSL